MSCWTDEKLYKLVQIYSKFSNLWDRKHHCYDNLRARYTSYKKILTSLSMPIYVSVSDVICKLKELRNIYVCELQKIEIASRVGSIYRPNYTWFEILNEFLYNHLDADEKLAEFTSSEDGTVSSEDKLKVCPSKNCCSDLNSVSDSESDTSFCSGHKPSLKTLRRSYRPTKKSQAYFLRSPTILKSTKMNTRYEWPGKKRAYSKPVKNFSNQNRSSILRPSEDMQQCTQLDVKMTSSDVSIKYLRTESVNGDEKCYKKNLKGPRCLKDKPHCFKNIKMIISKSGYTPFEVGRKSDEREDKDREFWEMMSMLDLHAPCPSTKMETTYSPNTSYDSITSINSLEKRNNDVSSSTTCCASSCKDIIDKNGVEEIIESVEAAKSKSRTSKDRFYYRKSCCPKVEEFKKCNELQKRGKTLLEPCTKKIKVMCLGDGTLFDNNLLELLQDLSIKICPIDAQCASGNCSTEQPDNVFDDFLSCRTCSSDTRPVKVYKIDSDDGDSMPSNRETRKDESADLQGSLESSTKPENDTSDPKLNMDIDNETENTNSTPLNTSSSKKVGLSVSPQQRNYDVKVLLKSAESRSLSERDAILHEAKKELWEAGKLYNGGKYIAYDVVDTGTKKEESYEFDHFGAEIASSLKMMGKERAEKLKQMIADTLRGEKINKYL